MKSMLLLLLALGGCLHAHSQSFTSLQYSMGFGTGDLGDFIGTPSFRGFTIDYRQMTQPNVGVGVDIGWNVFYSEKANDVYTIDDLSYSGKQYRYNNQIPILVAADYYTKPGEKINPFVGFALGTMFSRRNTDMGQYTLRQDAWHFAIRPEAGILIDPGTGMKFTVTGKYYYGFEAGELPSQGYFALNFGFVFDN